MSKKKPDAPKSDAPKSDVPECDCYVGEVITHLFGSANTIPRAIHAPTCARHPFNLATSIAKKK